MDINPNNIVNRKGGVQSSLYQMCLALRARLGRVPGFESWLDEMDQEEQEDEAETDPVTSMWNMLRRGQPLLTIYNSVGPVKPLELQSSKLSADKFGKQATFMFLSACMKDLQFPTPECFIITDLYGTDTTGFVKVLRLVNRVLDVANERGNLFHADGNEFGLNDTKPKSHTENVINEIVTTERDYVQHLETLQHFQNLLQQANVLPGDTIHNIFMNLNKLLDFQRRFLIRVEQQNSLDPTLQNWGQLFHMYQEQFRVYEPFIANQSRCNQTVGKEWEKIRIASLPPEFQGMVETQSVLLGFLLKPFQRLVKYPMLLDSLIKKGNYDAERVDDLRMGIKATNDILESANEAVAREARFAAGLDLEASIEDWKGHTLAEFGELLIFGGQTVLKGDGAKEVEREYKIYLFQKILLCCKDVNPNKTKNKLSGKSVPKGKQRLQLKGRIWISNITDIVTYNKNQAYYLHVYWRSDPAVENFVVRFMNIDSRDKWTRLLQKQRHENNRKSPSGSSNGKNGLYSLVGATLVNPYEDDEDDDGELRYTPTTNSVGSNGGMAGSRNASNTSLRARSATGGSGQLHASQLPPPRFPLPEAYGQNGAPLRVQTGGLASAQGATTPNDRDMASYFSPTGESPSSSIRSSQASTLHPFNSQARQSANTNNSWAQADHNKHMTAPAPARNYPDENAYAAARQQRPSLPAGAGYQHPPLASRSRSASSPHVQPPGDRRSGGAHVRTPNEDEPMPPLPQHMASLRNPINRSQSNSPTETYRNTRGPQQPPPLSRAPQTFPNNHDQGQYGVSRTDSRYQQSAATPRLKSPPVPTEVVGGLPSQLRVKVAFQPYPSHVTIVVPNIIRYQTLIDRIDSKMDRITSCSIAKNTARLKYLDSDGDLITIGNDDDIKDAIQEWMEANEAALSQQLMPDFELQWHELGHQR